MWYDGSNLLVAIVFGLTYIVPRDDSFTKDRSFVVCRLPTERKSFATRMNRIRIEWITLRCHFLVTFCLPSITNIQSTNLMVEEICEALWRRTYLKSSARYCMKECHIFIYSHWHENSTRTGAPAVTACMVPSVFCRCVVSCNTKNYILWKKIHPFSFFYTSWKRTKKKK